VRVYSSYVLKKALSLSIERRPISLSEKPLPLHHTSISPGIPSNLLGQPLSAFLFFFFEKSPCQLLLVLQPLPLPRMLVLLSH